MNAGKALFAQIMEFVPWTSFARIAELTPPKEDREAGVERLQDAAALWEALSRRELRSGSETAPAALTALARFRRDLHINIQPRLLLERLMLELE